MELHIHTDHSWHYTGVALAVNHSKELWALGTGWWMGCLWAGLTLLLWHVYRACWHTVTAMRHTLVLPVSLYMRVSCLCGDAKITFLVLDITTALQKCVIRSGPLQFLIQSKCPAISWPYKVCVLIQRKFLACLWPPFMKGILSSLIVLVLVENRIFKICVRCWIKLKGKCCYYIFT